MSKTLNKNQYVMNSKTGVAYQVTTSTVQTRGRRQVRDARLYKSKTTQIVEGNLVPLTPFEGAICVCGEKIIRGKQKMTASDAMIVALHRELKSRVMA